MQDIPWQELPCISQEATQVTRRLGRPLGVCLIQIYSLCILQDEAEDWRHEASLMVDIYKNSVLYPAAATGNHL